MPKNTTGGNKAKKGKNSGQRVERPLILADSSGAQLYGIIEAFGGSTATVKYLRAIKSTPVKTETVTAVGFVRNSLRKWCKRFQRGDVILICEREFEANKVDIVHKYNEDEIRALKRLPLEYSKIQPLVDAYSVKMDKNKTNGAQNECVDDIQFDEDCSSSSSSDAESDQDDASETQRMLDMNAAYVSNRSGDYKSLSARQRIDNPKYVKTDTNNKFQFKKQSGGRSIAPQPGTRELPPSDSEPELDDELLHI